MDKTEKIENMEITSKDCDTVNGKKVLVTGGSGFIGRYLIHSLAESGNHCISFDLKKPPAAGPDETGDDTEYVEGSLLDREDILKVIKKYHPDVIMHLAGISDTTFKDIPMLYNINVCGTENLYKAAGEADIPGLRLVVMSSATVYGNQPDKIYNEELSYSPENHYSMTKMVTEYMAKQYPELDIRVVRPFNIIGAGQRDTFVVPKIVKHFAYRRPELHVGNLDAYRDYIDINYCIKVLVKLGLAKDVKYKVYNICSGTGHPVREVIDILTEYAQFSPEIIIDPRFVRKNEVWRLVGDPARVLGLLDGEKCRDFSFVIKEMYDYYSTKGDGVILE